MKVLLISGDKNMRAGHPRFELQRSQVEQLDVVFWGRGSLWPKIPEGHYDVVAAQDPFWRGLFALFVARRKHAKLNVQVHADLVAQPLLRHILAQIILRHAHSIRVVSEKIKQQVKNMQVSAPITVLPVYIDVEKFRSIAPQAHESKTILWIGRFEAEKDPLLALSVFKEVRSKIDARLIMLGSGSLKHSLQQEGKDLPIEFPGWQDPAKYLASADVVLSTSIYEGFGASIIEALAAGVPVVAPDVGIVREAGAIVASREELADAVVKVLQSNSRAELKLPLPSKDDWAKQWKESL